MKHIIFSFFVVFGAINNINLLAQTNNFRYGKITKEEIDLKSYPSDKEAEAVVLFDIGTSYFVNTDNNFDVYFERKTKIKILSNAGLDYARIEIPFYQEGQIYEKIVDLEASTYNFEDGRINITKLDLKNCYDEKLNESWNLKKFAMPDVKEGSIIEFKYKLISPYRFNLRDWEFQWRIPVIYSEYIVKIVPFYEYSFILQGTNKLDVQTSFVETGLKNSIGGVEYKTMVYKFGMNKVPAFRDEEFITSKQDYIIKLDFQLSKFTNLNGISTSIITTWPEMINDMLKNENFGKYIEKAEKSASKIINLETLKIKNELDRAEQVINYVKSNYNWNGMKSKFSSKSMKDFLNEKTGNTANINLFLTGLLRAAGIEAYPVILSTRDNGKIKADYPFNHFFNYVAVQVKADNKVFLTDATEILCPFDQIPVRCINEKGLMIRKGTVEWIPLVNNLPSQIDNHIIVSFSDDMEQLKCIINSIFTGYDALYFRNNFNDKKDKIEEFLHHSGYKNIDSMKTSGFQNTNGNYNIVFQTKLPTETINGKLYISPFLIEPVSNNPLKQAKRTYPIDMTYIKTRSFRSEIYLPENLRIESAPEKSSYENDLINIIYKTEQVNNKLIVEGSYTFKKAVYDATDYTKIKYYFNEIIKKFNQKIVLVKE